MQIIRIMGNAIAKSKPVFKLSPIAPAISPVSVGPDIHPRSPARANKANKEVPPFGKYELAMLKEQGHIAPTENPQRAHPKREK